MEINNDQNDRSPNYWQEHYQLDNMPFNIAKDVINGYVVRVRPREYCLHHVQLKERARWGTVQEIAEDIAYLARTGVLPPASKSSRW